MFIVNGHDFLICLLRLLFWVKIIPHTHGYRILTGVSGHAVFYVWLDNFEVKMLPHLHKNRILIVSNIHVVFLCLIRLPSWEKILPHSQGNRILTRDSGHAVFLCRWR